MNVSGISSNNFLAPQIASQNQQTQQTFQQLTQELQANGLSPAQTTALQSNNLASSLASRANGASTDSGSTSAVDTSSLRHRIHIHHHPSGSGTGNLPPQPGDDLLPANSSSTAIQAYSTLLPDTSASLGSDLVSAQAGALATSVLSLNA